MWTEAQKHNNNRGVRGKQNEQKGKWFLTVCQAVESACHN